MEDVVDRIADKVQALSDVELAILLCLITEQHCIIETEKEAIDGLDNEIRLVCRPENSRNLRVLIILDCFERLRTHVGYTRVQREHNTR